MEIFREYDSLYILERKEKKIIVFAFMAVFVIYCPQFWGSRVIYKAHDTQYIFERHDQKIVLCLRAIFVSYCPQFWGSGVIYKAHHTQYIFERRDQKLIVFAFLGHFHELLPTVLGF
jgi:hypothetical protein